MSLQEAKLRQRVLNEA